MFNNIIILQSHQQHTQSPDKEKRTFSNGTIVPITQFGKSVPLDQDKHELRQDIFVIITKRRNLGFG